MPSTCLHIILSDGAARAVCWTLVHSLWEGVLAALLAGLVILCTRKQPATLRYNLLIADLLLFLLVTGATFFYELRRGDHLVGATGMTDGWVEKVGEAVNVGKPAFHIRRQIPPDPAGSEYFIRRAGDYLNTHAVAVTLIWLACLIGQMLQLAGGLYKVHRLRRDHIAPPGEWWNERLSVLARRLGIKRRVALLQSGLVKAPVVFGFLKPAILLPLGMLSNLPPDQVETILFHELAHIRRGDYIANLLLHLTGALFFFNPGMRWLATLIRREREACCDDMVLAGTPDRQSYFEALVAFTQFALDGRVSGEGSYALQLGGGKTDLVWRIRRMLEQENKKLQVMEKAILSFGLMAMVSLSLISMKEKDSRATKGAAPARLAMNKPDKFMTRSAVLSAVVKSSVRIKAIRPPQTMVKDLVQVPIMLLKADTIPQQQDVHAHGFAGKKITFKSMSSHSDEDDHQKKYYALAIDENQNSYEIRKLNEQVIEFRLNGKLIEKEDYERYTDVFESIEAERKGRPRPIPPVAPVEPQRPLTAVAMAGHATHAETAERAESVEPVKAAASRIKPVQKEEAPTMVNPLVFTNHPDPYIKRIALDLVESRLIDHVDMLSFTLNSDELIVNGARQPEGIYLKFKEKYVKKATDRFIYSQYYTSHGSGSHVEVHTDDNSASSDSKR